MNKTSLPLFTQSMKTVKEYFVEHQLQKPKIQKYSQVDIRHFLETATKDYFKFKKLDENHLHINVHLVLGYLASISALASAYYSYQHPFTDKLTRDVIIYGNLIYFVLYGLLMVFNHFYKKDIIFMGKGVEISMEMTKFDPKLKLTCKNEKGVNTITRNVGNYFTNKGEFCGDVFYDDLEDLLVKKGK